MLPESRRRAGARSRRLVFASASYRHALVVLSLLVGGILVSPAEAEFPFSRGGSNADPYAYQNYMLITDADDPGQFPPSDLGDDNWKYTSKTACDIYAPPHATVLRELRAVVQATPTGLRS